MTVRVVGATVPTRPVKRAVENASRGLPMKEGLTDLAGLARVSLTAAAVVVVAACSVIEATPDRIVVRFNTYHPEFAFNEAARHCAQYGKKPVLVRTDVVAPSASTFFTSTSASTFDCVMPPATEPQ